MLYRNLWALALLLLIFRLHAVEVGPYKVTKVVDGDTIKIQTDLGVRTIRILYVDTPESKDNSHGKAMQEGLKAKQFLIKKLPPESKVMLWGPGDKINTDRYGRLLAIPTLYRAIIVTDPQIPTINGKPVMTPNHSNLTESIIASGHSPYWQKYGQAPSNEHTRLVALQDIAKQLNQGAWATAPKYMQDKSNERSKPKDETNDALKQLDNAIVDELYKAAVKEGKTHWKSKSGVRHNKDCQWFGKTKDGVFCKADEGTACGKCRG